MKSKAKTSKIENEGTAVPEIIRKTYKFRLYPSQEQTEKLDTVLDTCRWLYNSALQEWRDAYKVWKWSSSIDEFLTVNQEWYRQQKAQDDEWWEKWGHGDRPKLPEKPNINSFSQSKQLTELKEVLPELCQVQDHILRDVLARLDKTREAFYARVKRGDTPGYPRFKGKGQYDSFTYPDASKTLLNEGESSSNGWHYERKQDARFGLLTLSMGKGNEKLPIKIRVHRRSAAIFGKVNTLTIIRDGREWYACFSVSQVKEISVKVTPETCINPVGIDSNLKNLFDLSNGGIVENPRYYRKAEEKLARLQRILQTKKRGSNNRNRAKEQLGKAHRHISRTRKDFLHKLSAKLVSLFDLIAFEELAIDNMTKKPKAKEDTENPGQFLPNGAASKAGLNKSILDASWATFFNFTSYKAGNAGKVCKKVSARNTTQCCCDCGVKAEEHVTLSVRTFICQHCGLVIDRDWNASINVLVRAVGKEHPTVKAIMQRIENQHVPTAIKDLSRAGNVLESCGSQNTVKASTIVANTITADMWLRELQATGTQARTSRASNLPLKQSKLPKGVKRGEPLAGQATFAFADG